MEMLEHRLVLSTFWVTNTADIGSGSLREAILDANGNPGADTIGFNIPTSDANFVDGAFVIQPLSALPALSDTSGGTTIDGSTQTAFSGDTNPSGPEIVLDGSQITAAARGLHLSSDNNQVHGLNIQGFSSNGIRITGNDNIIAGNYIGTDATGTVAMGNAGSGIRLDGSSNTVIGGTTEAERNVIADSGYYGIWVRDLSSDTSIQGNYLGTDASGTVPLGSFYNTIYVENSADTIIGGSEPGGGTVIQGNRIGTDVSGTLDLGNRHDGILVGYAYDTSFPSATQIGGTTALARNIISNNDRHGITIAYNGGNVIQGNYIGTDLTGTQDMGNAVRGIWLANSPDNLLGGSEPGSRNIISANGNAGIAIDYEQSTGNRVQGNYTGTDVTGTVGLGNAACGVNISYGASDNTVGTDGDGIADDREGNVISDTSEAHYAAGVAISGQFNVVAGNLIGTDASGTVAFRNFVGVLVYDSSNRIGTNGDGVSDELERNIVDSVEINGAYREGGAQHNIVAGNYVGVDITGTQRLNVDGGIMVRNDASNNRIGTNADGLSDAPERNVIAGRDYGHALYIENATGNLAAGDFIGVGADGKTPIGGAYGGVLMRFGAFGNTIGGTTEAERNVISGHGRSGIWICGEGSDDNVIQGNYIGLDAFGDPLGNGQYGIHLTEGASGNLIGGTQPGEGNVIAHSARDGVCVVGNDAVANTIRGNSIHANGDLGIDLGDDGPTSNDDGDVDVGPNSLQDFPVISRVESGATTRVVGSFHGAADTTLTLDFYANSEADPSGFGEGERWLGSAVVTTDTEGNASFDVPLAAPTVSGEVITATATAPDGSTSEFSGADVVARPPVQIDVKPGSDLNPINLANNGVIPVAILTTDSFDASCVDASTVVFAGAHAVHSALEDTDGDGDLDLILHFRTQETNLADLYALLLADDINEDGVLDSNRQTAAVSLTGQTATDEYFEAFDEVDLFLSGKNLRAFLEDLAAAGAI